MEEDPEVDESRKRNQEVLNMLIQQQRSKERARVEATKATVENAKKNPIWERDAAWLKQKAENIRKIAVEKEREAPDYTYAPKINNKSRQLAESRKSVSLLLIPFPLSLLMNIVRH
jgi:hypothetical protein